MSYVICRTLYTDDLIEIGIEIETGTAKGTGIGIGIVTTGTETTEGGTTATTDGMRDATTEDGRALVNAANVTGKPPLLLVHNPSMTLHLPHHRSKMKS